VYIKSQKASSSLSRLTKIVSWDRCSDEKSFQESAARKIWRRRHKNLILKDQSKTAEKNVTASTPVNFFRDCFWGRRPDGIAIKEALQIDVFYNLNGQQTETRNLKVPSGERSRSRWAAQSTIGALRATAPKWESEQIDFVVGNRRLVVGSDFNTKLGKLIVWRDRLLADHVTQVCEARSVDSILPLAGARTCEEEHTLKHTLTECQSWGDPAKVESGWYTRNNSRRVRKTDTLIVF